MRGTLVPSLFFILPLLPLWFALALCSRVAEKIGS